MKTYCTYPRTFLFSWKLNVTLLALVSTWIFSGCNPVSDAGGVKDGCRNTPITFDGSKSHAKSGRQLTTYIWNFGDGRFDTVTDAKVSHIYATDGIYNVTLKVKDTKGAYSSLDSTKAYIYPYHEKQTTHFAIPLGNVDNVILIRKTYYAGPNVTKFRLAFRFVSPEDEDWPANLKFCLTDASSLVVLKSFTRDINRINKLFWSDEISGNTVGILLTSEDKRLSNITGYPRLEIDSVETWHTHDLALREPKVSNALKLYMGGEVIAFFADVTAEHFFYADIPQYPSNWLPITSIYISPFAPNHNNLLEPELTYSGGSFSSAAFTVKPQSGDAGIYHEFPRVNEKVCIQVRAKKTGHYLLTVQNLRWLHSGVVTEWDHSFDGKTPPKINDKPVINSINGISDKGDFTKVYEYQLNQYINDSASSYSRRFKEMFTFASSRALAASEGYLRFSSTDLYHATDPFRDVDLYIKDCTSDVSQTSPSYCYDRENSNINGHPCLNYRINLYRKDLNEPYSGGYILHHEWGHYDYGMFDEYLDQYGTEDTLPSWAACPNSIMGTSRNFEFCSYLNHKTATGVPAGQNPAWEFLTMRYGIMLPNIPLPGVYPQNQATYLDVLHKLEDLIEITHHY